LQHEYGRRLAGWLGLEIDDVMSRLAALARGTPSPAPTAQRPDPRDPLLHVERETLKIALQYPQLAGPVYDELDPSVFSAPPYAAVHEAVLAAGGTETATAGEAWINRVRAHARDDSTRALVTELAVEQPRSPGEPDRRYAGEQLARIQEAAVSRRLVELKSRLQRVSPVEQLEDYNRIFGELVALEQYRRALRERAIESL
jgi:DNA primase